MSMLFYGHPFSSYCQKVLTALYENETPSSGDHSGRGRGRSASSKPCGQSGNAGAGGWKPAGDGIQRHHRDTLALMIRAGSR